MNRRQRQDARTGLPNREAMLEWLQREAVALRRGGRGAAVMILDWPEVGFPEAAIAAIEAQASGLRGRLAALKPNQLAALLGAPTSGALRLVFAELWQLLHERWGAVAAGLLLVDAPARIEPEVWLASAEAATSSPPTVRGLQRE